MQKNESVVPADNVHGVGPEYNQQAAVQAQKLAWQILFDLKSKLAVGMTEAQANKLYLTIARDAGVEKHWHPAKIRFGVNTIKSFREVSEPEVQLQKGDILFLDLGPIINGFEGDVGQSFIFGDKPSQPDYLRIITDGERIFKQVADQWRVQKSTGAELYAFAESLAEKAGWNLIGEGANGHRIGDFPHHVHYRGNLRSRNVVPAPGLWILEIQLRSKDNQFGAFYEDMLI